ncbi:MAG TPA: RtcB family protein [Rhodothermales bacterium]|nr:RtcB family protein [Rhodothermales bacterium]
MKPSKLVKRLGVPPGPLFGLAIQAAEEVEASSSDAASWLGRALDPNKPLTNHHREVSPEAFALLERVRAETLLQREAQARRQAEIRPLETPRPYAAWGPHLVDDAARQQMDNAMRLPVSVAGALMPDAHVGYGLPIGGVLATEGSVIPYAVGVDIACRMMLSVYPVGETHLTRYRQDLVGAIRKETAFGTGSGGLRRSHPVLEDRRWREGPALLRPLHEKAVTQLGSSGGGNHFVEWGLLTPREDLSDELRAGQTYLALLSHSGSRAVGFTIANHYTALAQRLRAGLPPELRALAWLGLDEEAGQEYWTAMNLAGDYASANHHLIHKHVAHAAGLKPVLQVENHHNFAWREEHEGGEVFVHRKGATPAGHGVRGIIPGSMGDPGFLVEGRGEAASLDSASHGAGRQKGRKEAERTISRQEMQGYLEARGVELLGGGRDEAPQAYKPIHEVMTAQQDLVRVLAEFHPRIVRMADDHGRY